MAKQTRPTGICHLCGQVKVLSFEHVPPEKAFNDKPAFLIPFEEAIHLGPDDEPQSRPKKQQAAWAASPSVSHATTRRGAGMEDTLFSGLMTRQCCSSAPTASP